MRLLLLIPALAVCTAGCTMTENVGHTIGSMARGTASLFSQGFREGLYNHTVDNRDGPLNAERVSRVEHEEGWKDYWRENPEANPKMTEAYTK